MMHTIFGRVWLKPLLISDPPNAGDSSVCDDSVLSHQGNNATVDQFSEKYVTLLLSGVPDYFYRNKISSGGDLSHYSSASLY